MRFLSLFMLYAISSFSPSSFAEDGDENLRQCRAQGLIVLSSWYQLDTCLRYQAMGRGVAMKTRRLLAVAYPKLQAEVRANSPFAARAKEAGTASSPYRFDNKENSALLASLCNTSVDFLHTVSASDDWKSALSCWR